MFEWIKLYRNLGSSTSWLSEPFTRGQAWLDLLLLTNSKPGHKMVAGERVDIDRGQCGWSTIKLAERWQWSRGRVLRYLNYLQEVEHQIEHQNSRGKNRRCKVITILNYDKYQSPDGTPEQTPNDTPDSTPNSTPNSTGSKKEKKDKKKNSNTSIITKKIKFSECVELTQEEYGKLVKDHGEPFAKECIDVLDNYIPNKNGKPYKDHYRAINSWVVKQVKNNFKEESGKKWSARDKVAITIIDNIRKNNERRVSIE
jgi:hypothetical protein